ncbi:unnamed protein product [Rotaria magnacalcarata]|uniref:DJ-1/PfpI domain-containing protein n=3 Tax=Rotaria magnacalcarata TaxID=392030 RepID=A0A815FMU0_9BILA|nr:unnamed protein product [Rotaria magnacalcarata]
MAPKKILMIVGDFVEDYEVMVPYQALLMVGHHVDVVCPGKKANETVATAVHDFEQEQTYTEKRGHNFTLTAAFSSVKSTDYDALVIPGGRAPEYLRLNKEVRDLVREFDDSKKPIASICHGLQLLAASVALTNRKVTGYKAVGPDLVLAGANYVEVDVTESMSTTDSSSNIPTSTTTASTENELDDLVSQLRQTINKSGWLAQNTSAKWEAENPDLAKQWREAIKTNATSDSTEQ